MYKITQETVKELLTKVRNANTYSIEELLTLDTRVLTILRLSVGKNRTDFAELLGKDIQTIGNLERGNKELTTLNKIKEYAEKLKKLIKFPINEEFVYKNYVNWIESIERERNERAIKIASSGGIKTSKIMTPLEKIERSRKAGLMARENNSGIHKNKNMWMIWSKIGLANAGRKVCLGPKNEKLSNELELLVGKYLYSSGINYMYEPMIKIDRYTFYPDFLVNKIIIECCYWDLKERWLYLAKKFKLFIENGFHCILVTKVSHKDFLNVIPKAVHVIFKENIENLGAAILPYGCQPPCYK